MPLIIYSTSEKDGWNHGRYSAQKLKWSFVRKSQQLNPLSTYDEFGFHCLNESTHVRLDNICPRHGTYLLKCKLTSVFSWMEPSMNLHATSKRQKQPGEPRCNGALMLFRNWKRLLRSSVDHYGKYRFARLRIVSLLDYQSSDPYETGPTSPSWSEVRHIFIYIMPFLLSQSLLWVQNHSVCFIKSRHEYPQHNCTVLLCGVWRDFRSANVEGYQALCTSIPTSSKFGQVGPTYEPNFAIRTKVSGWMSVPLRPSLGLEK